MNSHSEDSPLLRVGQQIERHRLMTLIDIRIDQLQAASTMAHTSAICAELLQLRQQLNHA